MAFLDVFEFYYLVQKFFNEENMMMAVGLTLGIAGLYGCLGKKLGANPFVWAVAGFGVVLTFLLLGFLLMLIVQDPRIRLVVWLAVYIVSWVGAIGLAFLIAYRNKLLTF